jgi:phosphoheptose isomerase/glycosyltransferase involved in cell wall biosynthesis
MKKRIAFISDHASPLATLGGIDSGGQNVYVAEVARCLSKLGYEIDIFTRRTAVEQKEVINFEKHIRVIHITAGPAQDLPKEELYSYMPEFSEQVQYFIEVQKIHYDLIHAHFWLSGMVAMDLKRELGIPFVITFHALGKVRRQHQGAEDRFPKQRETVEQEIILHADKIIAECPNDMKDLMHLYHAPQEKIEIIPCGYNPDDFYPVSNKQAKIKLGLQLEHQYILQLGRIVPRKGIDNVIEAIGLLNGKFPNLRLLIVGGDFTDPATQKEIKRLKQICQEKKIEDKVKFLGNKGRDELKYYYSASEIFVTTPWYEPFGITPLEAMACGTPVIGSDVGGISFTVRNNETGRLVSPQEPAQLASNIMDLLSDKDALMAMRNNAVSHVKRLFTWECVSDQINDLYQKVIPDAVEKDDMVELKDYFRDATQVLLKSANTLPKDIIKVANQMVATILKGNKIMICGNGGSAAESQHFVAELVGRFEIPERSGYAAISLNTDSAVMTAWANDFGYEYIFQRQVQSLGNPGDMLICLSTSGNSPSLLHALQQANSQQITTVNILGSTGGNALSLGEYNIVVPSDETAHIQEIHLLIIHQLCRLVEQKVEQKILRDKNKKEHKLIA